MDFKKNTTCERCGCFICHNFFVCACMSYPHLPDRVHAGGCAPAGYQQVREAPRPAPQSHTERTGNQTGSSLGSYRTAQNCCEHTARAATSLNYFVIKLSFMSFCSLGGGGGGEHSCKFLIGRDTFYEKVLII